jgi:hypothetical protein
MNEGGREESGIMQGGLSNLLVYFSEVVMKLTVMVSQSSEIIVSWKPSKRLAEEITFSMNTLE